jgi:hypothetical protein
MSTQESLGAVIHGLPNPLHLRLDRKSSASVDTQNRQLIDTSKPAMTDTAEALTRARGAGPAAVNE